MTPEKAVMPLEPTDSMLRAGSVETIEVDIDDMYEADVMLCRDDLRTIWKAMYEAYLREQK